MYSIMPLLEPRISWSRVALMGIFCRLISFAGRGAPILGAAAHPSSLTVACESLAHLNRQGAEVTK